MWCMNLVGGQDLDKTASSPSLIDGAAAAATIIVHPCVMSRAEQKEACDVRGGLGEIEGFGGCKTRFGFFWSSLGEFGCDGRLGMMIRICWLVDPTLLLAGDRRSLSLAGDTR